MIENKQHAIVKELHRRIEQKLYTDLLPTTAELADEFQVNVKTMSKAIRQLVDAGLLERHRHVGTQVRNDLRVHGNPSLIEVVFEGFSTIFTHPFWGEIWTGMVETLTKEGFQPVLNILERHPQTGLLNMENFAMLPSIGKIILGIQEPHFFTEIRSSHIPFIAACDYLDDAKIPQVSFDFTEGMREAVDYLHGQGCRHIAFLGQTVSIVGIAGLNKFHAFLKAIQQYTQVDPLLIADATAELGAGEPALRNMLDKVRPDAIIAAYDHQLPEIYRALADYDTNPIVIGCDGLSLSNLPPNRPVIDVPLHSCGNMIAQQLIDAIHQNRKPRSVIIPATFKRHAKMP